MKRSIFVLALIGSVSVVANAAQGVNRNTEDNTQGDKKVKVVKVIQSDESPVQHQIIIKSMSSDSTSKQPMVKTFSWSSSDSCPVNLDQEMEVIAQAFGDSINLESFVISDSMFEFNQQEMDMALRNMDEHMQQFEMEAMLDEMPHDLFIAPPSPQVIRVEYITDQENRINQDVDDAIEQLQDAVKEEGNYKMVTRKNKRKTVIKLQNKNTD